MLHVLQVLFQNLIRLEYRCVLSALVLVLQDIFFMLAHEVLVTSERILDYLSDRDLRGA